MSEREYAGFACPECGGNQCRVTDGRRNSKGYFRRRRRCEDCDHKFSTIELIPVPTNKRGRQLEPKSEITQQNLIALRGGVKDMMDLLDAVLGNTQKNDADAVE